MKEPFEREKIDFQNINQVLKLSSNILKITFIFLVIVGIYTITMIIKEWNILNFILTILKILSPVFIGLFIAWFLHPFVEFLNKKGLSKIFATIFVYIIMLTIVYFTIANFIPILINQINAFLNILPIILESITISFERFFAHFETITIVNIEEIKINTVEYTNNFITSLTTDIPEMTINFAGGFLSFAGIFLLGFVIGFYLLFDFRNIGKRCLFLFPQRIRTDIKSFFTETNISLLAYIKGTLLISLIIFISSAIALSIIGVEAALLLALIIGIADIIPYIGPYIGALPAVLVAFTHSITAGILTIIALFFIQTIEGNFVQPLIMSRTMKLHPVNIIVGILVFGYFFGIIGMIIATPLVAIIKILLIYINRKFQIFEINKKNIN